MCETKNNVWKRYRLSIQEGIDNYVKTTKIKLDSASLSDIDIPRQSLLSSRGKNL